jgi:HlyD family secretion protein
MEVYVIMKGKGWLKNFFSRKTVKIIMAAIIVAGVGYGVYKTPIVQKRFVKTAAANAVQQKTTTVKRGDINSVVSGSGSIYFDRVTKVASRVSSTVSKIYFNLGDRVKAGDLIAEFDDIDAKQTVNDKKNSLLQSQLSNEPTIQDVSKLNVKTPFTGQISDIKVKKGDTVSKGGALFTITDTSKLKVTLQFNGGDAAKLVIGQHVDVYLTAMMQAVNGTITYISSQSAATSSGGQVNTVEIQLENPGAVSGGMTVSAEVETAGGSVSSINTGNLEYISKTVVTSETGGTVESISIKDNQKVDGGAVVIKMKNDDIVRNAQLADMKVTSSKDQVESAEQQLSYYKIYAPIDGVISAQTMKVGDSVKTNDVVTTITDTNVMNFDITIDELDIAKISIGQKATISVDALTDTATRPIQGEVAKIAFQGTSQNGVTTFPVTVRINDKNEKIKGGMNSTANIQVGAAKDVLYVPIEAISKMGGKAFVWVKADQATLDEMKKNAQAAAAQGGQNRTQGGGNTQNRSANTGNTQGGGNGNIASQARSSFMGMGQQNNNSNQTQNYYENAVRKEVVVGINNDSVIEIKSGLKEGDVVILPPTGSSSANTQNNAQRNFQGGMTGGAAPAAAPSGQPAGGGRN